MIFAVNKLEGLWANKPKKKKKGHWDSFEIGIASNMTAVISRLALIWTYLKELIITTGER